MNLDQLHELATQFNLSPEITQAIEELIQNPNQDQHALDDDWMFQDSESEEETVPERYEDLGLLGVGGMGEVRKVRDTLFNRTLAMKIIHRKLN